MSLNAAAPIAASLAYSLCSIGMVLVNKVILSTYGLTYSMSLLLFQSACTAVLVYGLKRTGAVPVEDFRWATARAWLPINLLFLLMLYTGYMRCVEGRRKFAPHEEWADVWLRVMVVQLAVARRAHGDDIQEHH